MSVKRVFNYNNLYLRGVLLVVFGALVLSFTGLIIRQVEVANAWHILFFRSLGFVATLSVFLLYRQKHEPTRRALFTSIGFWGWFSAVCLGLSFGMYIYSLTIVTIAEASFIFSTLPLITAVLGWVILKENPDKITWVTICIVLFGITLMIVDKLGDLSNLLAIAISFSAPTFFSLSLIFFRFKRSPNIIPVIFIGGFVSLIFGACLMGKTSEIPAYDILWSVLMGLILGVGMGCYFLGTSYISAAHVALLVILETVLNPVWTWLGVGETPTTLIVIGGGVIIIGLLIQSWSGLRNNNPTKLATGD